MRVSLPSRPQWLSSLAWAAGGVALILALWEIAGRASLLGNAWPPFSAIVGFLASPMSGVVWSAAGATLTEALIGFVISFCLALIVNALTYVVTPLEAGFQQFATMLQATPVVVFGPILIVLAGRENTPIFTAAFITFYPLWVGIGVGLSQVPAPLKDMCTVFGTNSARRLRVVALPQALPATVDGIKLALPAAIGGAIIGEWFGSAKGLGVLLLNSMQSFQVNLLWGTAIVAAMITMAMYAIVSVIGQLVNRRWRA